MTEIIQLIINSLDNVLNYYNKNSLEVWNKFSEKSVHDLRVTIRRFLALLNVLNKDLTNGYIKLLRKQLKKELKLYNPLRDNQVQMIKIGKLSELFPILNNYLIYLSENELTILNSIKEKIDNKFAGEITESVFFLKIQLKQMIPKSGITKNHLINAAFNEYLSVLEMAKILNKNDLQSFHQLRIAFKKFRYTMEFLKPILNLSDNYYKKLKTFQDILGDIQDNRVLLENLNYWILNYDITNQSKYLSVIEFLINSRKNLFNKLNKRIILLDSYWDKKFLENIN